MIFQKHPETGLATPILQRRASEAQRGRCIGSLRAPRMHDRAATQTKGAAPPPGRASHAVAVSFSHQESHTDGRWACLRGWLVGQARACLALARTRHPTPGLPDGSRLPPVGLPPQGRLLAVPQPRLLLSLMAGSGLTPSAEHLPPSPTPPSLPCRRQHVRPLPLPRLRHHPDWLREVRGMCVSGTPQVPVSSPSTSWGVGDRAGPSNAPNQDTETFVHLTSAS